MQFNPNLSALLLKGPCLSRSVRSTQIVKNVKQCKSSSFPFPRTFFPQWGESSLSESFCLNRVQLMPFSLTLSTCPDKKAQTIRDGTANAHPLSIQLLRQTLVARPARRKKGHKAAVCKLSCPHSRHCQVLCTCTNDACQLSVKKLVTWETKWLD